ncbi:MAG: TIGR04219 family outer membrane beta-barrel protein [Nitrospira sp.]|nr:TIGR04219 family outer membrane beta-barrel protein [Nitrospira sp.]
MKRAINFLIVLLLLITPAVASAIGFEAALGGWNQDPSGYVSYKPLDLTRDKLDIDNDLRYDKKTKIFGRLKIDMPLILPNIYLMATPVRFEGDGQINREFHFGGETFTINEKFTSKVQLDHYDIAFYYGIPFLKTATLGMLNAEVGLNARIIDFKAEVIHKNTNISASKSSTIPVPMIYVGAQFKPVSFLAIEAEARGITYSSNHYYDLIGRVKIPINLIAIKPFIAAGYRYEDAKIDHSDILSEIKIKGPFIEAGVTF